MSSMEKMVLKHQFEEWRSLNDYVNKIELNYGQILAIMATVVVGLVTVVEKSNKENMRFVYFLIPYAVLGIISYVAYLFRSVAILRGYLAAKEMKMNEKIRVDEHIWNLSYIECLFSRNNTLIRKIIKPYILFIILLVGFCLKNNIVFLCKYITNIYVSTILFFAYVVPLIYYSIEILYSFYENEAYRRIAFYDDKIAHYAAEYFFDMAKYELMELERTDDMNEPHSKSDMDILLKELDGQLEKAVRSIAKNLHSRTRQKN